MPLKETAILIFAKSSIASCSDKFISPSLQKRVLLMDELNKIICKKVSKTQFSFFLISETEQSGNNFGQKITHAAESIFLKGYKNIIIVGNDCPQLSTTHILQAHKILQHTDAVIGRDYRGGAYLIGVKANAFCAATFVNLPWQTKYLHTNITRIFTSCNTIALPPLADINNCADAKKVVSFLSFRSYLKKIISIILTSSKNPLFPVTSLKLLLLKINSRTWRAPPVTC